MILITQKSLKLLINVQKIMKSEQFKASLLNKNNIYYKETERQKPKIEKLHLYLV